MVSELKKNCKNKFDIFILKSKSEVIDLLNTLVKENSTVGVGDSVTLEELDIYNYFEKREDIIYFNKYKKNISKEEKREIYKKNFSADFFVSGCNAITINGDLLNIDGNGSRVAPIIYGPKNVLLIMGLNKICKNEQEANDRARNIAAPLDSKRLNKNNPCTKTLKCHDCKSKDRICNYFVKISGQFDKERIKLILVEETLGF